MSILLSVVAIIVCGMIGGLAGWAVTQSFNWHGTGAAILATLIAMIVATAAWIGGSTLVRSLVAGRRAANEHAVAPGTATTSKRANGRESEEIRGVATRDIEACAARLFAALESATQVPPITAVDAGFDVAAGYAVLHALHARRLAQGWRPLGRKIGFTNRTIWERYGVYRPMWSHVWDRTVTFAPQGRALCALSGLMEPRIEPEVVFRLAAPVPPGDDPERILAATEWLAPGFEIVHSVFPGWKFAAPDCTAAFGLHGRLLVGAPIAVTDRNRAALARLLSTFTLTLSKGDAIVERGTGANVMGSPTNALAHLRDVLATQPEFPPLAAGEIVTTGTITDAWPVAPGEVWSSDYGELGLSPLEIVFTR